MSAQPENAYKFVLNEAAILLKRVAVNPSVSLAHDALLQQNHNALYPCRHILSRTYNIGIGSYNFNFENAFVGHHMPTAVYIAFVKSEARAGSLTENPFCFNTVNLQELYCRLGSKKIPAVEYRLRTGQDKTIFSLWETYNALDYMSSNTGPGGKDRQSFQNGAFLLGFDLSRDSNPNAMYQNAKLEGSSLSIEGSFSIDAAISYTGTGIICLLILL